MTRLSRATSALVLLATAVLGVAPQAEAVVMCGRKTRTGQLADGASVKLRPACRPNEIQLDPVMLGLQGPQGETGLAGPTGPQGGTGPAGPPPADVSARLATAGPVPVPGGPPFFSEVAAPFGTELWDTDSLHSDEAPTRLTIAQPGKYMIYGHLEFLPGGNDNSLHMIRIVANGTTTLTSSSIPDAGNNERLSVATHYEFAAGDYVELLGAANLCCFADTGATFMAEFGVVKVP